MPTDNSTTPLPLFPVTSDIFDVDTTKSLTSTPLFYDNNDDINVLQNLNAQSSPSSSHTKSHTNASSNSPISTNSQLVHTTDNTISTQSPPQPTRVSTRTKKQPAWLSDYTCHLSIQEPYLSNFTESYVAYMINVSKMQEPFSYKEVTKDKDWVEAMQKELQALEENET